MRVAFFLILSSCLSIGCAQPIRGLIPDSGSAGASAPVGDPADAAAADDATDPADAPDAPAQGPTGRRLYGPPPADPRTDLECYCLRRARRTSNWITAGVTGGMLVYGLLFWDYGTHAFEREEDGAFEADTKQGGADKFGHATSSATGTAIFSAINRRLGIPRREAAMRGALTTLLYMTLVEVGDGFSEEFGFSYGDMIANTSGCVFGYFQETSPRFDRLFDLRWEYVPTSSLGGPASEPTTDYDGSSYILALNVGALAHPRRRTWLDVVDFQVGYQTRNYVDMTGEKERTAFVGVGINFANLLRRIGLRGIIPSIFEYYQPPYTSLRVGIDL